MLFAATSSDSRSVAASSSCCGERADRGSELEIGSADRKTRPKALVARSVSLLDRSRRLYSGVKTPETVTRHAAGVVLPRHAARAPRTAALEGDLATIPLTGRPLPVRARFGRPSADAYLVATRGPLPYMIRLREIEQLTARPEAALRDAWSTLAKHVR